MSGACLSLSACKRVGLYWARVSASLFNRLLGHKISLGSNRGEVIDTFRVPDSAVTEDSQQ